MVEGLCLSVLMDGPRTSVGGGGLRPLGAPGGLEGAVDGVGVGVDVVVLLVGAVSTRTICRPGMY